MKRTLFVLTAAAATMAIASPALAWTYYGGSNKPPRPSSSSTSSGGQSSTTSSGGSHQVPEPGVLGLMGAGLIGLGLARRRKARR